MYDFEWIYLHDRIPELNSEFIASDGYNLVIMKYEKRIFIPIRTVDIHSKLDIIPTHWYPLNEIILPESNYYETL